MAAAQSGKTIEEVLGSAGGGKTIEDVLAQYPLRGAAEMGSRMGVVLTGQPDPMAAFGPQPPELLRRGTPEQQAGAQAIREAQGPQRNALADELLKGAGKMMGAYGGGEIGPQVIRSLPGLASVTGQAIGQGGLEALYEMAAGQPIDWRRVGTEAGMVGLLGAGELGIARAASIKAGLPQKALDFVFRNPRTAYEAPSTGEQVTLVEQLQKNLKDALGEPQMAPNRITDRVPRTEGRHRLDNIISRADERVGLAPNTLGGQETPAGMVDGRELVNSMRGVIKGGGDSATQAAEQTIANEADTMLHKVAAKAAAHPQNRAPMYGEGVYRGGGQSVVAQVTPGQIGSTTDVWVPGEPPATRPVIIPGSRQQVWQPSRIPEARPEIPQSTTEYIEGRAAPSSIETMPGGRWVDVGTSPPMESPGPPASVRQSTGGYWKPESVTPETAPSAAVSVLRGRPLEVNMDRPLWITHREYDQLLREHLTKPSTPVQQAAAPTITTIEDTANTLRDQARAAATDYGYRQLNREGVTYPTSGGPVTAREAGRQAQNYLQLIERIRRFFPEGRPSAQATGGVVKAGEAGQAMLKEDPTELGFRIEQSLMEYQKLTGDPIYDKFKEMAIRGTFSGKGAQPYLANMARIFVRPGGATIMERIPVPTAQKTTRFFARRTTRPAIRSAGASGVGAVAYPPIEQTKEEGQ